MNAYLVLILFILLFNSLIEIIQLGILIYNRITVIKKVKEQERHKHILTNSNKNVGDKHTGMFNIQPEPFIIFDKPANRDDVDAYVAHRLCLCLEKDDNFEITSEFLSLPNASVDGIRALHAAHIEARKKSKQ